MSVAQRSTRQARLLLASGVNLEHLVVQSWPNLHWGRFNNPFKLRYYSIHECHFVVKQVKEKMLHSLRCASLFFHVYTDVPLPSGITISGAMDVYKGLTHYLGLPSSLSALLKVPGTTELIDRYLGPLSLQQLQNSGDLNDRRVESFSVAERFLFLMALNTLDPFYKN